MVMIYLLVRAIPIGGDDELWDSADSQLATGNPMQMINSGNLFWQQNLGWTTGIWANWKKQPVRRS